MDTCIYLDIDIDIYIYKDLETDMECSKEIKFQERIWRTLLGSEGAIVGICIEYIKKKTKMLSKKGWFVDGICMDKLICLGIYRDNL